jgi:hypothetical protein
MYLQKVMSRKTKKNLFFVGVLNPLVIVMNPQIRIRTKMSWISNTGWTITVRNPCRLIEIPQIKETETISSALYTITLTWVGEATSEAV